ncbi:MULTISPECIES: hypothetical protein [Streptomyces]|uniref:Uncharacterized protein n=1 Tax=Streptomyces luomodiensis TaxID=3026192 RepID=A0ABY9VAW7_9ACTN|nr:hypothetical protein [Streptomyces sp. SCA4-21]WNF01378.1 hypothetical protein PS467_41685 [Streptomyces sp. SCA4-21]
MIETNAPATLPAIDGEQPSPQAEVQIWTTSVDQEEAPSSEARVDIEVSKAKLKAGMRVPGHNTGQMINASTRVLGITGSVAGPFVVLKLSVDLQMPWQGIWALALVIGILPVIHVLLGNHHDKQ